MSRKVLVNAAIGSALIFLLGYAIPHYLIVVDQRQLSVPVVVAVLGTLMAVLIWIGTKAPRAILYVGLLFEVAVVFFHSWTMLDRGYSTPFDAIFFLGAGLAVAIVMRHIWRHSALPRPDML